MKDQTLQEQLDRAIVIAKGHPDADLPISPINIIAQAGKAVIVNATEDGFAFSDADLSDLVAGSGTLNVIPLWTPDGNTIGDSVMSQSSTLITIAGTLTVNSNADGTTILGRTKIGSPTTDEATFAHFDHLNATDAAIRQLPTGATIISCEGATSVDIAPGDVLALRLVNTPASAFTGPVTMDNTLDVTGLTRILTGDFTVSTGDVTVTAGDVTVTAGDIAVTAGGINVGSGIISAGPGTIEVRGNSTDEGIFTLSTSQTVVVATEILGQIDFQAPVEASGAVALNVGASIWAVADGTFDATNNPTALVFATGAAEIAVEKMRLSSAGDLTLNPGDLIVTAGDATITAGDLTITAGDVSVGIGTTGGIEIGAARTNNRLRSVATVAGDRAAEFSRNIDAGTVSVVKMLQFHTGGAQPVLELDQNDVSEEFIDFLGTDQGAVATSTTDSDASVIVAVNGTKYNLPLFL